jgi:peptidyl-prolyl cis-trans isomerase SurA
MKQIILLLAISCSLAKSQGQTIFTFGTNEVGKDEFLRAYNKNNTPVTDKEAALKEYLELYTKFKLKVQAAKEARLDTLQQLKYDLQNFRSQVEENYLQDDNAINALIDQAIQRSQVDIHLLHFSVNINNKMSPADTLKAHKAMEEVRANLLKGKTNYDEIVEEISGEIIPIKGKDLGYITALSVGYDIENLVYALKSGGVSEVYRTKTALHVFKNADQRPGAGKWKIAQILFAIPPDVTADNLKLIERKADSVYSLLQAGESFADMAKKFSDDRLTYQNAGELPEFGTGKFEQPFEKAVFALQKDGDISQPIYTGYGFHIVKRLQVQPIPTGRSDENFVTAIKQQILQDGRINAAKANFVKALMTKIGFKRNAAIKDEQLFRYADSVVATNIVGKYPINKTSIFSFSKLNVTGADWLNFVKDYKLNPDVYKNEDNPALLQKYIATTAMEYYRKHLEEYNNEFKYQLQEFREGNMLFEIMERNVWTKASNDSAGLKQFYQTNKAKYLWEASASVYLFNCNSGQIADSAVAVLQAGKDWKLLAEESDGKIQADSGRYELAQIQLPAGAIAKEGLITTPTINTGDNTASFVKVLQLFPAGQQRSFEEARGIVINEYQNYLEEKWIAALKKKYPVKVNEEVFKELVK